MTKQDKNLQTLQSYLQSRIALRKRKLYGYELYYKDGAKVSAYQSVFVNSSVFVVENNRADFLRKVFEHRLYSVTKLDRVDKLCLRNLYREARTMQRHEKAILRRLKLRFR